MNELIIAIIGIIGLISASTIIAFLVGGDDGAEGTKGAEGKHAACFSILDDYFKFRLENDNKTDYMVVFPCPEESLLNQTVPKDESGK